MANIIRVLAFVGFSLAVNASVQAKEPHKPDPSKYDPKKLGQSKVDARMLPSRISLHSHAIMKAATKGDTATLKTIASADADHVAAVASILFHPNAPKKHEVVRAFVVHLSADAPARRFAEYWLSAPKAAHDLEREFWRVSARMTMNARRGDDPQDVLALGLAVMEQVRAASHSHARFLVWRQVQELLNRLGQHEEAKSELNAMVEASMNAGRLVEAANRRQVYVEQLRQRGEWSTAIKEAESTLALATRARDWVRAAELSQVIGNDLRRQRKYALADHYLGRAYGIAKAANLPLVAGRIRISQAGSASVQGQRDLSIRLAQSVFESHKNATDPLDQMLAVRAATQLTHAHRTMGQRASALRMSAWLEDHIPTLPVRFLPSRTAPAWRECAMVAAITGDRSKACHLMRRVAEGFKGHEALRSHRVTALALAIQLAPKSDPQRLASLAEFRDLTNAYRNSANGISIWWERSKVERLVGNPTDAQDAATNALRLANLYPDSPNAAVGLYAGAHAAGRAGKHAEALELLSQISSTKSSEDKSSSNASDSSMLPAFLALTAKSLGSLGRHDEAVPMMQRAIRSWASMWHGVDSRDGRVYREGLREWAEEGISYAHAWAHKTKEQPGEALRAAWWFAESMRSWPSEALKADTVSDQPGGNRATHSLDAALQRVEASHRSLILATVYGERDRIPALRSHLELAQKALAKLATRQSRVQLASHAKASTAALPDVKASLDSTTAVVHFIMADEQCWGLAVNGETALLEPLGKTKDVQRRISLWRDFLATPGSHDIKLAGALYETLLRPLEPVIGSRTRLLVVPDGALATVPLDALLRKGSTPNEADARLIERANVTHVPSFTVYRSIVNRQDKRSDGRGVIALGGPTYPHSIDQSLSERATVAQRLRGGLAFPPLPASRKEATAVSALFKESDRLLLLGKDATVQSLVDGLRRSTAPLRVLHIATHGIIDDQVPSLSGLVLSGGHILTAERIRSLDVSVNLAVLSACDSGTRTRAPGKGFMGISRALLQAGVSSVVCSQWQLVDERAADLCLNFHKRYATTRKASQSLRLARLDALKSKDTSHPFYWGGFQLWGMD